MSQWISPRSLALLFGCLSTCYGMKALIYPSDFAVDFGFPSEQVDNKSDSEVHSVPQKNPFVIAYGGRTMALGSAIILLAADNQVSAAGTVTLCCAISGLTDAVNCYTSSRPMLQHAVGTVVLSIFGFWLRSK